MMNGLQILFLALMVVSGFIAITSRDLLAAVVTFGVFSFFTAILYALMGALDVAFIEAVVGVVTPVFFVSAIYRTSRRASS